jgi:hypothetical protein
MTGREGITPQCRCVSSRLGWVAYPISIEGRCTNCGGTAVPGTLAARLEEPVDSFGGVAGSSNCCGDPGDCDGCQERAA